MEREQYEAIFTAHGYRKDERGDYVKGDYDIWITVFESHPPRFMVRTKRFTHQCRPVAELENFLKHYLIK